MKRLLLLAAACGAKPAPAPAKTHNAPRCAGVVVLAKPEAGTAYPSWLAAWQAIAHPSSGETLLPPDTQPPTDDTSARALLCGDAGCPDTGPWIVGAGTPGDRIEFSLVMPSGAGLVVFADLADGLGGACQYQDDIDTTPGKYFRVVVTRNGESRNDAGGGDCEPDTDEIDYAWFDPATRTRVLAITTDSAAKVTATANGVDVLSGTCTQDLRL